MEEWEKSRAERELNQAKQGEQSAWFFVAFMVMVILVVWSRS